MFILAVILLIVAAIPLIVGDISVDGGTVHTRKFGAVIAFIGIVFMVLSTLTVVSTKNVGVVTAFNRPSGEGLSNGIHFKKPWEHVTDIDGTIQTDRYHGNPTSDGCTDNGIKVAIGDGSQTCMSVVNRWRINPDKAAEIYQNYKSDDPTEHFREAVVSTELIAAVVDVARTYNPITQLRAIDPNAKEINFDFSPDYDALGNAIEAQMRERTHGLAEIIDISVTALPLPAASQKKVNDFTKAVGETRIQQQNILTNRAKAEANRVLAESLKANPAVNQANCQQLVAESAPGTFPAGFQCNGSGGSVVVPAK